MPLVRRLNVETCMALMNGQGSHNVTQSSKSWMQLSDVRRSKGRRGSLTYLKIIKGRQGDC